jgi:hypothetical protein
VVITDIGVRTGAVSPHIASALIGEALLSVLIFPTLAGVLRPLAAAPPGTAEASERGRRLTPAKRRSRAELRPRSAG